MTIVVVWLLAGAAGYVHGWVRGSEWAIGHLARKRREARQRMAQEVMQCECDHGWERIARKYKDLAMEAQAEGRSHVPVTIEDMLAMCEGAADYAQVRVLLLGRP